MSAMQKSREEIVRAISAEWRAGDDLSEAMLELALRVQAARSGEVSDG